VTVSGLTAGGNATASDCRPRSKITSYVCPGTGVERLLDAADAAGADQVETAASVEAGQQVVR
jgi:hypothetical protein